MQRHTLVRACSNYTNAMSDSLPNIQLVFTACEGQRKIPSTQPCCVFPDLDSANMRFDSHSAMPPQRYVAIAAPLALCQLSGALCVRACLLAFTRARVEAVVRLHDYTSAWA